MKNSNFTSGLRIMSYPLSLVIVSFIFFSSTIYAEEQKEESAISIELLEFLGEWETDDGDWVDPMEFDDDYFATINPETGETGDE